MVFVRNAFSGWGFGAVQQLNPTGSSSQAATGASSQGSIVPQGSTMTASASGTGINKIGPQWTNPESRGYLTVAQGQAAVQAAAQQRSLNVNGWVTQLRALYQDSFALFQQVDQQWPAVMQSPAKAAAFVEYMGLGRRARFDANAQQGIQLRDSVVSMAGADAALAALVAEAQNLASKLVTFSTRAAELERAAAASANVQPATGAATGQTLPGPSARWNFPVWGYVVGGAAILGAAWYFGRKG